MLLSLPKGGKDVSTFAERLSEVIADSKLTKTKFAEVVGISQPFLSQICSGVKVPSSRTVSDICSKFHVDEIWLRTGDGKMHLDVTRREAVADFLAEILSGGGTPEQIAFISVIAKTSPEQWELFRAKLAELNSEISLAEKENGENTE